MGRVYSQSQGKFIDQPDATTPAQTGGAAFDASSLPTTSAPAATTPTAASPQSMTSLGIDDKAMRNLFFQMGLANPKSINSLKDLYGFIAPKSPTASEQKTQKAKDDLTKAYDQSTNTIGNILTQFTGLSDLEKTPGIGKVVSINPFSNAHTYNQQRKGLYASLKDIAGAGSGSGVRINNYDIKLWADLLPEPGDTQDQIKTKITSLNKQLTGKFGQGLDPEYLNAFGVTPKSDSGSGSKYNVLHVSQ